MVQILKKKYKCLLQIATTFSKHSSTVLINLFSTAKPDSIYLNPPLNIQFPTMQFTILPLALFLGLSYAVNVAPQHAANGGCAGPAQDIPIGVGQTTTTNGVVEDCVFNTNKDKNFNMLVCSNPDLTGMCINLSALNRVEIDGFFNWQIPFGFLSMQRNGN